jgi:uncharacterized OB-fold protein
MDIPRYWRLRDQRYRLKGSICKQCGWYSFPPRQICPKCKSHDYDHYFFSGNGTIYTYTIVYQSSDAFSKMIPYTVAIVELDEGPKVTAQITDVDHKNIHIGMPVELVIRKISERGDRGPILYGYKFRPPLV